MGEKIKQIIKKNGKKSLLIIIVVAACLVLASSSTYVIMKWIVKRVTESAKKYTNDVTINDDGTVSTGITAQELWDDMIKKGYEVDKYLDNADELAYLMNAELVTQIPYTGAGISEPIYNYDNSSSESNMDNAKADELYYRQKVSVGAKKWPNNSSPCAHVAMTLCIKLLNGDYKQTETLTPEKFYRSECKKFGESRMLGAQQTSLIMKAAREIYGVKTKKISNPTISQAKQALNNGSCLWISRGSNVNFITEKGKKRKFRNGHTIMFYKYKDGYFYAKDDSGTGGPMCKYSESDMNAFLKGGSSAWIISK